MQKALCILLLILSPAVFADDIEAGINSLPLDQCKLQRVINILTVDSAKRAAKIAKSTLPTIQSIVTITGQAKIPNEPLATQLSPTNNWEFGNATQRLTTEELVMLIESMYQRDLNVIENLIRVDDEYYRWNKIPNQNDPDAIYFLISVVLEQRFKTQSKLTVPKDICSLNYAISDIEAEQVNKLNQLNVDAAIQRLQEIKNKYQDISQINTEDKSEVRNLLINVIEPAKKISSYIQDIENIKRMANISKIMYESYMTDILYSGGNINSLGKTLDDKVNNGNLDKDDDYMIRLWIYIDDKIPSQMIQDIKLYQSKVKNSPK